MCKKMFAEAAKAFENRGGIKNDEKVVIKGASSQIHIEGWPKIHYEFHCTKARGMDVALHIEDRAYKEISQIIKNISESKKINKREIVFNPAWSNGAGAIQIYFGKDYDIEELISVMRLLIDETKAEVSMAIKNISNEKK